MSTLCWAMGMMGWHEVGCWAGWCTCVVCVCVCVWIEKGFNCIVPAATTTRGNSQIVLFRRRDSGYDRQRFFLCLLSFSFFPQSIHPLTSIYFLSPLVNANLFLILVRGMLGFRHFDQGWGWPCVFVCFLSLLHSFLLTFLFLLFF